MGISLSDVDTCVPGHDCEHDGCARQATDCIELEDDDTGHRWWEAYCAEHVQEALRPFRVAANN